MPPKKTNEIKNMEQSKPIHYQTNGIQKNQAKKYHEVLPVAHTTHATPHAKRNTEEKQCKSDKQIYRNICVGNQIP